MAFPTAFVSGTAVPAAKTGKVTQVLREAMDWRAAHPDETVKLVAAMNKQTVEAVTADAANSKMLDTKTLDGYVADGTVQKWLSGMGDYFVGAGKLPSNPDPATYYLGFTK